MALGHRHEAIAMGKLCQSRILCGSLTDCLGNEHALLIKVQGVLNHYFSPASGSSEYPVPVDLLVTGSVPAGSGLSSSAAMVVASTLAFLAVNGKLDDVNAAMAEGLNKGKLVEMSMENEKRVGERSLTQ